MNYTAKRLSKLCALLMALIMLTGTFSGCKLADNLIPQLVTIESSNTDSAQTEETPVPEPTFAVSEEADAAFHALDLDVFRWYATLDGYSFHMFIDDPANFQIDRASVNMTLGEFTTEDSVRISKEATVYLDRLTAINREQIKQESQFSYDVLQQILTDLAEEDKFEYFYEPLTRYSGLQSNLPLSFALFELKNQQDVEDYLTLLADMPRYMGQILAYEQKRAELGMFMTETALNEVLAGCKAIIDSKNSSFLYTTFSEGVGNISSLTPEQAKAYEEKNASLLQNEYVQSFQTLYDGLSALRSKCRTYEKASQYNEQAKEYFEKRMQDTGCNSLSVEETLEMLKAEMNYLLYDFLMISNNNPKIFDKTVNLSSGDSKKDLEYLQALIQPLLPELPEHNLTLSDVPPELQKQFSPAAYVIPAIDDWKDNTIFLNPEQKTDTLLFTLAHEGYPGHMYQYIYQRSLDNLGLMQRAANFGGYAEGWAEFAEYLAVTYQDKYDQEYVRYRFDYDIIINVMLPAIMSILVNYYGYSKDAVENAVTGMGLKGDVLTPLFYETVIDEPYYFFEYAVGYAQLAQLYRETRNELDDKFDMAAFLKTYLDLGPANFDLIREQIDVWSDRMLQDAA